VADEVGPGAMTAGVTILRRTAGWIALTYGVTIASFQLFGAISEGGADVFLLSLIFILWLALPVIVAALLAAASETRLGAALFLALELAMILSVILLVADFTYFHPSSMGGVALIFWPLLQLAATLLLVLLACLFGWRIQPEFLKDEAAVRPPPPA
jgi:hypothetical protein